MRYSPQSDDLRQELQRIRQFTEQPSLPFILLELTYAAPAKPVEGMVICADGVTWNPGAGRGVYCYHGAAWAFLG